MKIRVLLLSSMLASPCFALQTYKLVDQQKTQVTISKKQHTRIAIEEDRIQQIFGAEGQFEIESDDERGQIFLKPLDIESTKAISMTIVTEAGLTQDLRLIPKSVEAQSILFKPAVSNAEVVIEKKSRTVEISDLMQAMMRGDAYGDYDKRILKRADRKLAKEYKLDPVSVYRGDVFTGRVYRLTNHCGKDVRVIESKLAGQADVAISSAKKLLKDKESTLVYIISKTGGFK